MVQIIVLKLIKNASNCPINGYLQVKIGSLVIFNISFFAKGVPSQFQAG